MFRDTEPSTNQQWLLSQDEYNKFYKGDGFVSLVLDESLNITSCYYHAVKLDRWEHKYYEKTILPFTRQRTMDGWLCFDRFIPENHYKKLAA